MNKQHFCKCLNFIFFTFLTSLSSGAFCFQCSYIFCSAICRISTDLTLLPLSTFACNHKNSHTCNESFMLSVWGQLSFTGRQHYLNWIKEKRQLDGQTRQTKSSSQSVNLPSAWLLIKHLALGMAVLFEPYLIKVQRVSKMSQVAHQTGAYLHFQWHTVTRSTSTPPWMGRYITVSPSPLR